MIVFECEISRRLGFVFKFSDGDKKSGVWKYYNKSVEPFKSIPLLTYQVFKASREALRRFKTNFDFCLKNKIEVRFF